MVHGQLIIYMEKTPQTHMHIFKSRLKTYMEKAKHKTFRKKYGRVFTFVWHVKVFLNKI